MITAAVYVPAALAEIGGCFSFWAWLRMGKSTVWLAPGCLSLVVFAWLLTLGPADNAGRAYAVYGGVYIVASLAWSWAIEGIRPDHWDVLGAIVCIVGAGIILLGPRAAA
jgi:small multidrug resistance family-3 protein